MKKLLLIVPLAVLFVLSCEDKEEGVGGLCVKHKATLLGSTVLHQYKCYDIYTEKECYDREESGGWYYTFYENYETCGEFCNSNDRLTPNNCN